MSTPKRQPTTKGKGIEVSDNTLTINVSDVDDCNKPSIDYYDHVYKCTGDVVMTTRFELCKGYFDNGMFIHHLCQVFVQNPTLDKGAFAVHYPKGSTCFVNPEGATKFSYVLGNKVYHSDTFTFLNLCIDYTMNTKPKSFKTAFVYVKGEVHNAYKRAGYNELYGVHKENGVFQRRYDK